MALSAGEACNYEPRHKQLLKTLKLLTSAMSQGATDPATMREIRSLGKCFLGQGQARRKPSCTPVHLRLQSSVPSLQPSVPSLQLFASRRAGKSSCTRRWRVRGAS